MSTTCIVNKGDLPIDLGWWMMDEFGNERHLITNDGIVISRNNPRTSVLTIESVKPRHRANFKCVATNSAGSAEFSKQLAINGNF